MPNTCSLQKLY